MFRNGVPDAQWNDNIRAVGSTKRDMSRNRILRKWAGLIQQLLPRNELRWLRRIRLTERASLLLSDRLEDQATVSDSRLDEGAACLVAGFVRHSGAESVVTIVSNRQRLRELLSRHWADELLV